MSFSEMMESGRGPGVIGMLMAVAVLAIFGMLFVFAFDDKFQGGGKTIESIIADQAREIAEIKNSIADVEKQLPEIPVRQERKNELTAIKRENQTRKAQIESLQAGIKASNEEVAAITLELESHKDKYRAVVRGKAKGEIIARLEVRDGQIYENVTIREVTPIGVQIMHDGGHKRIPFEQLPAPMIDRFQFDPKQKAAAIAAEEAQRTVHETAVSEATAAEVQDLADKKKADAEERKASMVRSIAVKKSRLLALKAEIASLEDAILREGYKRISRAPQMRIDLSNKQRELSDLQANVARMQAEVSR
jgi:folylpolyglutamate synthase/dihydropteroate synthase